MSDRVEQLEAELLELKAVTQRRSRRQRVTNDVLRVLVLAFGGAGAAYAVTLAPANSVNTAAIIDRTIGTPDVKVGAFAGQTILDNSMTGADIKEVLRRVQLAKAMQEARSGRAEPITQQELLDAVRDLRGRV